MILLLIFTKLVTTKNLEAQYPLGAELWSADWGKLGGKVKGEKNFSGIKVTWPELKCIDIRRTPVVDLG